MLNVSLKGSKGAGSAERLSRYSGGVWSGLTDTDHNQSPRLTPSEGGQRDESGPTYTGSQNSVNVGSPKQAEAEAETCMATESPYYPNASRNGEDSPGSTRDRRREEGTRKGTEGPELGGKGDSYQPSPTISGGNANAYR